MGLFSYIGNKIKQANQDTKDAQDEAMHWNVRTICLRLQQTSNLMKCAGYVSVLRDKCEELSDDELKSIFDYEFNRKNGKACNGMLKVMKDRGLVYTEEDGRVVRTYR